MRKKDVVSILSQTTQYFDVLSSEIQAVDKLDSYD